MRKIKNTIIALLVVMSSTLNTSTTELIEPQKVNAEDVLCLARNIYHESRGEAIEGQIAVAVVTINRAKHPEQFKPTICGVVYEPYQFSWTLDKHKRVKDEKAWNDAVTVARAVLTYYPAYSGLKAHYYHTKEVRPKWAKSKEIAATIGNHIFYY